jgi:hypothetical protein
MIADETDVCKHVLLTFKSLSEKKSRTKHFLISENSNNLKTSLHEHKL